MKRIQKILGMLTLASFLVLSGCGSSGKAETPEPTKAPVQTEKETTPTAVPKEETTPTAAPKEETKPTEAPAATEAPAPEATATPVPAATETPTPAPTATPEPTPTPVPENPLNKNGWIFTGNMEFKVIDGKECIVDGDIIYTKSDTSVWEDYIYFCIHCTEGYIISQSTQSVWLPEEMLNEMRANLCDGTCADYVGQCFGMYEGMAYTNSETGKKYALVAHNYYLVEFENLEQVEKDANACIDYFWKELVVVPEVETKDGNRVDSWKGWTFDGDVRTDGVHTLTKVDELYGFHYYKDENGLSYVYQAEEFTWLFTLDYKQ